MELRELGPTVHTALEQMLGYLNFSSGSPDSGFLANINLVFAEVEKREKGGSGSILPWKTTLDLMESKLDELSESSTTFQDANQAKTAIDIVRRVILPEYLAFHKDVLFHQTDATLFRPFFLGKVFESVLAHSQNWDDHERIVESTLRQLNDYTGYRPVPILESRRIEAYPNEKVRPIPLYIQGVGVCTGPYEQVVRDAIELLESTDSGILRAAFFDPQNLQELAVDPRSYDFEHPVNKRPNYHFGQWDPHSIDTRGFYHRFVIQQVTLNALMQRVAEPGRIPRKERQKEAAAVLAGTILMASGVSGSGPDTHDSNSSLGTLLPRIATYRDAFYERLIEKMSGKHRERLDKEATKLRQPFGGARQHLNAQLTRRRASQLEHVRLASLFARMGYPDAAQRQIDAVPVTSARMVCQIDCNISLAQRHVEENRLDEANNLLRECRSILLRGIKCGAIVDPWNILAFDGNYSLFPHLENTVPDHRVDQLVEIVDELCDLYSQLWGAAAAADESPVRDLVSDEFREFTKWWHKYAVHETTAVQFGDPDDIYAAAESVADALGHWHKGGESTGDIAFWAPYVERFDAPRAYQLVVQMLLHREDYVASRALLAKWLEQADRIQLEQGEASFHRLSTLWLSGALRLQNDPDARKDIDWATIRKFFDYMEANAGAYWSIPEFELGSAADAPVDEELEEEEAEDETDDIYSAAYEDVVYRDSTDDGMESSIFDTEGTNNDQLEQTHDEIVGRLSFLNGLSKLRKIAAIAWVVSHHQNPGENDSQLSNAFQGWCDHIASCRQELVQLLAQVSRYRLSKPYGDFLAVAEFDRQRMIRESLLEHIISCSVEMSEAWMYIMTALPESDHRQTTLNSLVDEERNAISLMSAVLTRDVDTVKSLLPGNLDILRRQPILYVPLSRGGNPRSIIAVRNRQQMIRTLLAWLPRLGLLSETRSLVEVVRQMERNVAAGPGAVTEFDDLFEVGYRALVEAIIRATDVNETAHLTPSETDERSEVHLVSCLERMTESMLVSWLAHSRTLRLSVLEKIRSKSSWDELVDFIKKYGRELFTQQFLTIANVRALLFQGVEAWFDQLEENGIENFSLLDDMETHLNKDDAVRLLTIALEAVAENYTEYRDYNSTTTQSDRGDLLYNLLDFLRLLSNYERVVWNLKPVVLSHELLVRHECNEAAQMWRRALADRISEEADRYLKLLAKLQKQYAMRLSTIADRLGERFLRPMIVDRMKALVNPAMVGRQRNSFEILEEETALLMRDPSGVGFEVPQWLMALEDEVQRIRFGTHTIDEKALIESLIVPERMTIAQYQKQLDDWDTGSSDLTK